MAANEIHLNDVGTQFIATIFDNNGNIINLSSYTTLQLHFTKPDGIKVIQTAVFLTNGSDGNIYYTTVTGDLNQKGFWKLQGYVALGSNSWYSDIYTFRVVGNI